jgi:GTP cyclohydrolase I
VYVPGDDCQIVGLSKIPRMFADLAARPQVQERLTQQTVDLLVTALRPAGVWVEVVAEHSCMTLRGARSPGSTRTVAAAGCLIDQR